MKILPLAFALTACTTCPEAPKPMRARAIDPEQRKAVCARQSRNDDDYARCLGVKWESLDGPAERRQ